MQVVKPEKPVQTTWLWQQEDGECASNVFERPFKTWLVFGVFYLDKFKINSDIQIANLLEKLQEVFIDWNEFYPWSEYNKICLQIEKTSNREPFIFGQICVEDNVVEEESIIAALLQKFSLEYDSSQVFVKVCDTDGEFLLAEASDAIPEEYEYPVAMNRLWLHQGQFKVIPNEFCSNRGLQPNEALEYLENMYYKLTVIQGINFEICQKVTRKYPDCFLSNLFRLPLVIEDEKCSEILNSNPQIISFALKNMINEEAKVNKGISKGNVQEIEVLVPKRFCDLLSMFLDVHNLKENPSYIPLFCGRAVSEGINNLLRNSVISLNPDGEKMKNNSKNLLASHSFALASLDKQSDSDIGGDTADGIIKKLTTFFEHEDDGTHDDDDDDGQYDDRGNEAARRYFQNQNIDIDEDDFLEFFLSDALKMSGDNIEGLRSDSFDNSPNMSSKDKGLQDELQEFFEDDEDENISPSALVDLLKSMSVDGSLNGPLQTILKNITENE